MIPINFRKDLARSHLPHAIEYLDRPEGVRKRRHFVDLYNYKIVKRFL